MEVWFTVQLTDAPGSLARVATALGERGVNITGIVGVAEDTDGALMLTTSDAERDRALAYANHVNSYVVKPTDFDQFQQMVRDVGCYWSVWNRRAV